MSDTEKKTLLDSLRQGREKLGRALDGVGEDLAARQPPNGGWSILGCVEHVYTSERYLLSRIDGLRTVEAIIQVSPIHELDALRCFKGFVEQGLIELR